jgi:hypothetical protein
MDLYPSLGKGWTIMVERVVDGCSLSKASFDTMPDHLDIILEESPGMRDLERPYC